jgi:hypothetical protein
MKRALYFAVLLTAIVSATMPATPPPSQPPYDYRVSLYKQENRANADGGWTEKVLVYLGNDLGPAYNVGSGPDYTFQVKVVDPAGRAICSEVWRELSGIPTGRTYAPYSFQVMYPKPDVVNLKGHGRPLTDVSKIVRYRISAVVYAEHGDKDTKPSNNAAEQEFAFTGGGTPSCTRLPRNPQLEH